MKRRQQGGGDRGDHRPIEQRWIPEFRGRYAIANSCFPIQIDRGQSCGQHRGIRFVHFAIPFSNQPFLSSRPLLAFFTLSKLHVIKYSAYGVLRRIELIKRDTIINDASQNQWSEWWN